MRKYIGIQDLVEKIHEEKHVIVAIVLLLDMLLEAVRYLVKLVATYLVCTKTYDVESSDLLKPKYNNSTEEQICI